MLTIDTRHVDRGNHQYRYIRIGHGARPLPGKAPAIATFVPQKHVLRLPVAGAEVGTDVALRECDLRDLPPQAADAMRLALLLVQDRLERLTISHD